MNVDIYSQNLISELPVYTMLIRLAPNERELFGKTGHTLLVKVGDAVCESSGADDEVGEIFPDLLSSGDPLLVFSII